MNNQIQSIPREQQYDHTCPKCKAHLSLEMSMTITYYISEVVITKD